jgi:hypothetical protein
MKTREDTIRFIRNVMAGTAKISDYQHAFKLDSVIIIVKGDMHKNDGSNVYHVQSTDLFFSEQEMREYIQGIETVLFLPSKETA